MYKCLENNVIHKESYSIQPYREDDLLKILSWRNEQIEVLRQSKVLTVEDQIKYYKDFIIPSFANKATKIILFSFLENKKCIGYGGLTNIDWPSKRAEISFLLETNRSHNKDIYSKDFSTFLALLKEVAFDQLRFNRLFTETYSFRKHHIRILEDNGFQLEGTLKKHTYFNGQYIDSIIHGYLSNLQSQDSK